MHMRATRFACSRGGMVSDQAQAWAQLVGINTGPGPINRLLDGWWRAKTVYFPPGAPLHIALSHAGSLHTRFELLGQVLSHRGGGGLSPHALCRELAVDFELSRSCASRHGFLAARVFRTAWCARFCRFVASSCEVCV